ncbi:MAG: response regulator [Lachnospiraceae bacterium]|nr:response regulator [Lachnospiraceae bacterium]
MKKILLFGKFNDVLIDINKNLNSHFHVQLCDLKSESAEDMIRVYEPDLTVISLVGAQDYEKSLFRILSVYFHSIPVLTIGTEREKESFLRFYEDGQFQNLIRPLENRDIVAAVCRRLRIPVIDDRMMAAEEPSSPQEPTSLRENVLVVDDDPLTLRGIREMLRSHYDVSVATSGTKALTAIGKRRPDLIILDYEMPVCDGKQTLEMIRADEELKDIPVIFLTGFNDKAHVEAVLRLKPEGYLLKPPTKDDLISAIRQTIDSNMV